MFICILENKQILKQFQSVSANQRIKAALQINPRKFFLSQWKDFFKQVDINCCRFLYRPVQPCTS